MDEENPGTVEDDRNGGSRTPIRVLLLDDREDNLIVRSAILRQKGYAVLISKSVEEAEAQLDDIDIAVLDYNLGQGKFGTEVAESLRRKRPQVPIIILSATLERKFGGIADMHLLKGYSSVDDLVSALRSFEGKQRGRPVVVDARDFADMVNVVGNVRNGAARHYVGLIPIGDRFRNRVVGIETSVQIFDGCCALRLPFRVLG